jgi:acyl carrier protein
MHTMLTEPQTALIQDLLMRQLDVTRAQLTEDAHIMDDLGADSLDVVQIGMDLEEHLGITLPDERWDQVRTVGELYAAVSDLLTAQRGCH